MIRTIKAKLLTWNLLVMVSGLVLLEMVVYFSVQQQFSQAAYNTLLEECREIAAQLHYVDNRATVIFDHEWKEHEHTEFGRKAIYLQLSDANGHIVRQSINLIELDEQLPITPASQKDVTYQQLILRSRPFVKMDYPLIREHQSFGFIAAAYDMSDTVAYLEQMKFAFWTITPLLIILAAGGMWLIARSSLSPIAAISDAAGKILASRNLQHQIEITNTDREIRKLIELLNQLFAQLDQSFQQIRNFSADAAHELRTPLTIIRSNIDVLLSREREVHEYRETLQSLQEEVILVSNIIDNLLSLAQIESGNMSLQMGIIRLDKIVSEQITHFSPLFEGKKITLESTIEPQLEIAGDRERMIELVRNLLENAIKYNRENGKITINLKRRNGQIILSIADTGIGIAPDQRQKIFDRFYRVDKARSRQTGGTGLGLSIVKWIADEHQAEIDLKSEIGRGSRFEIRFPVVEYDDQE